MDNKPDLLYKCQLRHWMIYHLDNKTFPGVRYCESDKQYFMIPWTKVDHSDDDNAIFKAYGKHKNMDPSKVSVSQMKGKFRSTLHKSNDFEIDRSKCVENMQFGNVRVYKILTPAESEEKKRRTREKCANVSAQDVSQKLTNSVNVNDILHQHEIHANVSPPLDFGDEIVRHDNTLCPGIDQASSRTNQNGLDKTFDDMMQLSGGSFLTHPEEVNVVALPPDPCQSQHLHNSVVSRDLQHPESSMMGTTMCSEANTSNIHFPATTNQTQSNAEVTRAEGYDEPPLIEMSLQRPLSHLEEFLCSHDVPIGELSKFAVTIEYDGVAVKCEVCDLARGVWLLYSGHGDHTSKIKVVELYREDVAAILRESRPLEMPAPAWGDEYLSRILNATEIGVVLQYDRDNHALRVSRFCQSRVFVTSSCCPEDVKLQRYHWINAFSFGEYIKSALSVEGCRISSETKLSIGQLPSDSPLVQIRLETVLAGKIQRLRRSEGFRANGDSFESMVSLLDHYVHMFSPMPL